MSFFSNFSHPKKLLGKLICFGMNHGEHVKLSKWCLSYVKNTGASENTTDDPDTILDIGCGGGGNLGLMSAMFSKSTLTGLDHSDTALSVSASKNRKNVKEGRVKLVKGDVYELPFDKDSFSLVTAFECTYFFDDLARAFSQISKITEDNGRFLIGVTAYTDGKMERFFEKKIEGMKVYTVDDYTSALRSAGFSDISVQSKKHGLCIIAQKHQSIAA
ncbi:MAG: class I SAM-dependent methyltransferase [Succinivibrio sp.]